jgi:hypothetical protein
LVRHSWTNGRSRATAFWMEMVMVVARRIACASSTMSRQPTSHRSCSTPATRVALRNGAAMRR